MLTTIMSNVKLHATNVENRTFGLSYFQKSEQRLEALTELLEEDLCGLVDDARFEEFTKRITGNVDQALTEETCWFNTVEFN